MLLVTGTWFLVNDVVKMIFFQQPETGNQKPETSNQQPATSNQ